MAIDPAFVPKPISDYARDANLYETATNTQRLADETAKANRYAEQMIVAQEQSAEAQREMAIALQESNMLMGDVISATLNTNAAISDLDRHLEELGATISAKLNAQLETQRRSVDIQEQQLDVQEQQLALHRQHYAEIERDKALKHTLYEIEKQIKAIRSRNDPVERAFEARLTEATLKRRSFSSRDLYEISDKRLYDELLDTLLAFNNDLPGEAAKLLDEFFRAYALRQRMDAVKPDGTSASPKMLPHFDESSLDTDAPEKPFADGLELTEQIVGEIKPMLDDIRRGESLCSWLAIVPKWLSLILVVAGIASAFQSNALLISIGMFCALVFGLYAITPYILPYLGKVEGFEWLDPPSLLGELHKKYKVRDWRSVLYALDGWDEYLLKDKQFRSERRERMRHARREYKDKVRKVEEFNKKLEQRKQDHRKRHAFSVSELDKAINNFLDRYPACQSYLPKLKNIKVP